MRLYSAGYTKLAVIVFQAMQLLLLCWSHINILTLISMCYSYLSDWQIFFAIWLRDFKSISFLACSCDLMGYHFVWTNFDNLDINTKLNVALQWLN